MDAGYFRFVPAADDSGSDDYSSTGTGDQKTDYASFTYRATDGIDTSSTTRTAVINIAPVADEPVIKVGGVSVIDGEVQIAMPPDSQGLTVRQYTTISNISGYGGRSAEPTDLSGCRNI